MNQQPSPLEPSPPSRAELLAECHRLVNQISTRPGCIKLLLGIVPTLKLYAGYKANREPIATRSKRKPKPKGTTQ